MLKNDYLVAKIGVDTAENEPREMRRWPGRDGQVVGVELPVALPHTLPHTVVQRADADLPRSA